nr:thiol-disulfide oxidoreductase LTO1-like [Ziziphus jujuba var. spinosa]
MTSMAASSAYFLYTLSTKFMGVSCFYCLLSALLSFSLFFITQKDFGLQQIQKVVGLQLFIASLVVLALNSSYSSSQLVPSSLAKIELPYFTTEITSRSSPFALSLANHLQSIGAKMYGAFWCSHYLEQRQMFGSEAAKLLNYVEYFPDDKLFVAIINRKPTKQPIKTAIEDLPKPSSGLKLKSRTKGLMRKQTIFPAMAPKAPKRTFNCFSDLLNADFSKETLLINDAQIRELAMDLEASGQDFIRIVFKQKHDEEDWIPKGFEKRMEGKGLIVRGIPTQAKILNHETVGGL